VGEGLEMYTTHPPRNPQVEKPRKGHFCIVPISYLFKSPVGLVAIAKGEKEMKRKKHRERQRVPRA
jgi:hypothetical protein